MQHRYFPVNFANFLRTIFYKTPIDNWFPKFSKNPWKSLLTEMSLLSYSDGIWGSCNCLKDQGFKLLRFYNKILVPKMIQNTCEFNYYTFGPPKHHYWNSLTFRGKNISLRSIHNRTHLLSFFWIRMVAATKSKDMLARFSKCLGIPNKRK